MRKITAVELRERILNGESVNLLDVREPDERAEYNIGGIFLPLGNILSFQTDEIDQLKDKEVICYCRSGKRSMQACLILETMGFTNTLNLEGGVLAWQELQK